MNLNKLVSLFFASLLAFNVQADILTDIKKCADNKDSIERLVCYDNIANSLKSITTPNAPVVIRKVEPQASKNSIVAARPSVAKTIVVQQQLQKQKQINEEEFGEEHLNKSEDSIDEVFFTVKSVRKVGHNKLSITFENGQVWQQSDNNYIKISSGGRVKLSKGMLGVIYLKTENQKRRIKVKRRK